MLKCLEKKTKAWFSSNLSVMEKKKEKKSQMLSCRYISWGVFHQFPVEYLSLSLNLFPELRLDILYETTPGVHTTERK